MAAYAAVVSLTHILDLIKNHPSPPISLDKQQVDYLTEILTFLQEFLEGYVSPFTYSDEADPLEIRISEAVYAAEDVIESYIVDNIHVAAASTTHDDDDDDVIESYIVDSIQGRTQKKKSRGAATRLRVLWCKFSKIYQNYSYKKNQKKNVGGSPDHLAAAAAHDEIRTLKMLESYTVDSIQLAAAATHHEDEQIRYFNFYEDLQKVTEAMDLMKKEAMGIIREKGGLEAELPRNVSVDAGFKSRSSERKKSTMVGFEDELLELKKRLLGRDPSRQIIPIVGMGGIGKTTLARKVFGEQLITEHFDICVWATISQDYNIKQTLREVLSQIRRDSRDKSEGELGEVDSRDLSEGELGEDLHKCLFGRRYLVVMDDMWSIEAWDKMRSSFPDCGDGSRVIVTTRMSDLASHLTNSSNSLCMSFLNEVDSWTLFSKTVFGDEESSLDLDLELREVGNKIVRKCKGLPLSIDVIGGLLSKSKRTREYWEEVAENLNAIVNLENEEYCSRVLKLSYNNLPAYLKPCFLYMGVFDEDSEIEISTIIKLWVSEGFVKPSKKKENLETIAREYFQELVDRNLVLLLNDPLESQPLTLSWNSELGLVGNAKLCKMHDLLRDLSLREAKKQRFYHVARQHYPPPPPQEGILDSRRRIVIAKDTLGRRSVDPFEPMPYLRSFVCHDPCVSKISDLRLLRTLHTDYRARDMGIHEYSQADVFRLVNSRLLAIALKKDGMRQLASSISQLWSLHTLFVHSEDSLNGPVELWDMHQLKHVEFSWRRLILQLPPPSNNDSNIVILENLHTLIGVKDFHLNEDVVTRIPNLRILDAAYEGKLNRRVHSMSYLQSLSKLESFRCFIEYNKDVCYENLQEICFPRSLKQIFLREGYIGGGNIELEDILQKAGWLPLLEDLRLVFGFFKRGVWKTSEGQFPRLKVLELRFCNNLRNWTVSGSCCFPLLQKLSLLGLTELEEIPSEIGEIATLKSIELYWCSESVVLSAKKIVVEQEDLYGEKQTILSIRR